jgi:hypothetical protein
MPLQLVTSCWQRLRRLLWTRRCWLPTRCPCSDATIGLILPILFKTAFYWVTVFFARLLERFVHFSIIERNPPADFFPYLITTFSWHRFSAISLWILVLFLIYVTASEFSHLFGPGELRRLFFTSRPSELQLNRRQRIRELLRLSRLMDMHPVGEFRDPTSPAHGQLIEILQRLAR